MNRVAAAKAVGIYTLLVVLPLAAWIGGMVWSSMTGQDPDVRTLTGFAPLLLLLAGVLFSFFVWMPITSIYDHFNRKGGK